MYKWKIELKMLRNLYRIRDLTIQEEAIYKKLLSKEYHEQMEKYKMKKTRVIFRKFIQDGDIIAIFPNITFPDPCYGNFETCLSYMQKGQHSECDYLHIIEKTVSASKKEYADLYQELTNKGYELKVIKKT